jgi:hypothetical protein
MDQSPERLDPAAQPVGRGPREHQRIGFVGRSEVSKAEAQTLRLIGRSIAALGHTLISVPSEGATAFVREGVEVEKGQIIDLQSGVLETADHTLLYPSPKLLLRLKERYPDIETDRRVTILRPHQLELFWKAIQTIMAEQSIDIPA